MRRVIIESPYRFQTAEEYQRNLDYLYADLRDSIDRDESPYASHLFIPQVLDDNNPEERLRGIGGMRAALKQATTMRFPHESRKICV